MIVTESLRQEEFSEACKIHAVLKIITYVSNVSRGSRHYVYIFRQLKTSVEPGGGKSSLTSREVKSMDMLICSACITVFRDDLSRTNALIISHTPMVLSRTQTHSEAPDFKAETRMS